MCRRRSLPPAVNRNGTLFAFPNTTSNGLYEGRAVFSFKTGDSHAQLLGIVAGVKTPKKKNEDVVLLQEVWVVKDATFLMECARKGNLWYSHHFKSGIFGSGLVTLARFPITRSQFWAYQVAGDPMKLHVGDYYASKGLGWCRLNTPSGEVDVVNTHLHANYNHEYHSSMDSLIPMDPFAPMRVAQILELSTMINLLVSASRGTVILGGDLNCRPNTLEFNLLLSLIPSLMRDTWSESNGDVPGCTCNNPGNSFTKTERGDQAERIDYVLSTAPCLDAKVIPSRISEDPLLSYSDHDCIKVVVDPTMSNEATRPINSPHPHDARDMVYAGLAILRDGQRASRHRYLALLTLSIMNLVLSGSMLFGTTAASVPKWLSTIGAPFLLISAVVFCIMGLMGEAPQGRALMECREGLQRQLNWELASKTKTHCELIR